MRAIAMLGFVGLVGLQGCASVGESAARAPAMESAGGSASLHVGPARMLDARVNPSAGVAVAANGDAIVVRYARPRSRSSVVRLDPQSLDMMSEGPSAGDSPTAHRGPIRVALDDGRFVIIWASGDGEQGYRAIAQAFNTNDGSPRGAPVVISPNDTDVVGSISAVSTDGHRVVATFAATNGAGFAAYAVPLELPARSESVREETALSGTAGGRAPSL